MADDLKTNLATLIRGAGKKKFFFAYGTGKRKDGEGDGHLIVGTKKPKKDDVKDECACATFSEGRCWSADGEAILFQAASGKLGGAVVAKMALTAKKQTGKQYDFRVPTPEEEDKAKAMTDSDIPEAPPMPDGAPKPPKPPPPPGSEAAAFKARLQKLMPVLEPVISSNKDVKLLVSQANVAARKMDFAQANALLDQTEKLVKKGTTEGTGGDGDLSAHWEKRRKELEPALLAAVKEKRGDTGKMRAVFAFAEEKAEARDYAKALQGMDQLAKLLQAQPSTASPSLAAWQKFHQLTIGKLKGLAGDLAGSKHPRGKEAEIEVQAVIRQLTANPASAQQVAELETYLKGDRVVADVCEMAFDFRTDALKSLAELKSELKK